MESSNSSSPPKLVILIPVYNDWPAVITLIEQIENVLSSTGTKVDILLIDDYSTNKIPDTIVGTHISSVSEINIIHLRRNFGHQRAIAIGLTYQFKKQQCDGVIVMDGDGEDNPEDIPNLINHWIKTDQNKVVFAARKKRMEGLSFKFFYRCYQIIHRILTGHSVRIGNFSIIPSKYLSPLVVSSELWNHYAASVYKLRIPFDMIKVKRGKRFSGKSKMNFIDLVIHGLSAISVFGEIVGTRILIFASIINLLLIVTLTIVFLIKFTTDLAIPGWATYTSGLLLVMLIQILSTSASFLFFVLNNRNASSFLPLRDYSLFIKKIKRVYCANE